PVTDDFESYAPFAETGVGEWLFVDGDGMPVGAITDVTLPGIEWFTPHAWWVMDNTGLNESFKASSGTKYLAQMYAVSDPQATQAMKCDDWIISPMLTGQAQTLTFKARSYSATYAETFEVLWSDGSTELADFNKIAARNEIAATWQTYTFAIPEGARRFAIRCTSYNRFMLFVDDVTFIPESERNLTVEGYNVWRDGQLITPVPVTGTSYVDNGEAALAHVSKYVVTTVYDKGESAASNEAVPGFVSIDGPDAGCVAVYAAQGRVIVKGAAGRHISLCGADGRSFYSGVVAGDVASYRVPAGIVIVKAGDSVFKLIVE
ncbi:MAG: choice-of-anchor J domain-containing protein, partial [Muribaculaceae bacterium]|nr:choice-of-anchor J domain-containing protein [Muribaculaceae bacterium]